MKIPLINLIPLKYKPFILPIFVLVIVIVLSLTVGRIIFTQVLSLYSEIESLKQKNVVLASKQSVLSSQDLEDLKSQAQTTLTAVPADTPSLPTLLSIRTIAATHSVNIGDFRVDEKSDPKNKKVREIETDLTVYGSLSNVLLFLQEIKNYPPLMQVTTANIRYNNSVALARVTISTVWSPIPTNLGKVEDPIQAIDSTDEEVIGQLRDLRQLSSSPLNAAPAAGKTNPFSF